MTSELLVDAIKGVTAVGNITVTSEGGSATMQLQQGLAKVFFEGDGTASSNHLADSLNVGSFTDTSTGAYSLTFTNNFASTAYVQAVHCNNFHGIPSAGGHATTGFNFQTFTSGNINGDSVYLGGTATGDLA